MLSVHVLKSCLNSHFNITTVFFLFVLQFINSKEVVFFVGCWRKIFGRYIYVKIDARHFIGFFVTFYLDHPDLERITTFMVIIYSWLCLIAAALFVTEYIGQLERIFVHKRLGKLGMNIKFTLMK